MTQLVKWPKSYKIRSDNSYLFTEEMMTVMRLKPGETLQPIIDQNTGVILLCRDDADFKKFIDNLNVEDHSQ